MIQKHYINGVEVNPPNNYEGLEFEIIYDRDGNANVSATLDLELGVGNNDAYNIAANYENITQMLPYRIDIFGRNGQQFTAIDGGLNLFAAEFNEISKRINAQLKEINGLDWLSEVADGVTFEYLYEIGFITDNDLVNVGYTIKRQGAEFEFFLALSSTAAIVIQITESVKNINAALADTANPLTTPNGVLKLVLEIIFVITLLATYVTLILQLIDLLIQPVKYHKAFNVLHLIEKGLSYFNLELQSPILQSAPFNQLTILPEKFQQFQGNIGRFKNIFGNLNETFSDETGVFRGTIAEILDALRQTFYAKIIIRDGILYFVPDNFRVGAPTYILPQIDYTQQSYKRNFEDYKATFILEFQKDFEDRNIIVNYIGNAYQVNTVPAIIPNQRFNLGNGLERITLPFAMAKRKDNLTVVEQIIEAFLQSIQFVLNLLISVVNGVLAALNALIRVINRIIRILRGIGIRLNFQVPTIPPIPTAALPSLEKNRIGLIEMESDMVAVPKMFLLNSNGRLPENNAEIISAKYLYENFHYLRNFAEGQNQWLIQDFENIPINFDAINSLRQTNLFNLADGTEAEMLSVKFNPRSETMNGTYRYRKQYLNNLNVTKYEPK